MKNLLFSVALLLFGYVANASNVPAKSDNFPSNQISKTLVIDIIPLVQLSSEAPTGCTVTIKKKNADGTWSEYTITVHDMNCASVIRSIIESL